MRLDRLLAIINLLLNRRIVPAPELAEYFELSVRTIYRDLEAINAAGIPIVSQPGNRGGFGIMENYRLDRQLFTFKDMVSTLSVLRGVNRALGDKNLDAAIEKIKSLAPREKKPQLLLESEQMAMDVLPWGTGPGHQAKLDLIRSALAEGRLIRCVYFNSQGLKQPRVIEPMTLVFKGSAWYLFGYCRSRKDFRVFRLTRMQKLEKLRQTFPRRQATYGDYLDPKPDQMPLITLRLKFAPALRYRLADYLDVELLKPQPDSSVIAEITFPENDWIYGFLLSFGSQVEVLAPEKVRRELAARSEKIAALYKPDMGLSQSSAKIFPVDKSKRRRVK